MSRVFEPGAYRQPETAIPIVPEEDDRWWSVFSCVLSQASRAWLIDKGEQRYLPQLVEDAGKVASEAIAHAKKLGRL